MSELNKITNYHIEEIFESENLSERTKNVCKNGSLDTLYKILHYYLKNGNFKKIRNCGDKTNRELISLAEKYVTRYNLSVNDLDVADENYIFEKFKFFCFENFGIPSIETEKYKEQFYNHRFPFFEYLLITLRKVLNDREYFIFEHNFHFFNRYEKMTLQAIGDIYGITRERIRQISQMIPYKLEETVQKIADESEYFYKYFSYKLDNRGNYILINDQTANKINTKESIDLTPKFYAFVFSILNHKTHSMFQDRELVYKNYYLINNDIFRLFDFARFYDSLKDNLNDRIEETYTVPFDSFIAPFYKKKDIQDAEKERIYPICKNIAAEELGVQLNDKGEFVFERNTLIKLSEYIIDILQSAGRPMHLREIHDELSRRTNKTPQNIESLRSSILSIDDIVAIGKTSTYSLKEWATIKTGTIKELVKEYLSKFDEPKHITDISDYVTRYRDTNDKNILSNLKLDRTKTFVFFKKGYIGLASKKYSRLSGKYGQLKLL